MVGPIQRSISGLTSNQVNEAISLVSLVFGPGMFKVVLPSIADTRPEQTGGNILDETLREPPTKEVRK
jgi:hypothetical protein